MCAIYCLLRKNVTRAVRAKSKQKQKTKTETEKPKQFTLFNCSYCCCCYGVIFCKFFYACNQRVREGETESRRKRVQQKRVNCKCSVKQKYKQQTTAAEAATTNHRQTNREGDKKEKERGSKRMEEERANAASRRICSTVSGSGSVVNAHAILG